MDRHGIGRESGRGVFFVLAVRLVGVAVLVGVVSAGVQYGLERGELFDAAGERAAARDGDWVVSFLDDGDADVIGENVPAGFGERARSAALLPGSGSAEAPVHFWRSGGGVHVALTKWDEGDVALVCGVRVRGLEGAVRRALLSGGIAAAGFGVLGVWFVGRSRRSLKRSSVRLSAVISRIGKTETMRDVHATVAELDRVAKSADVSLGSLTSRVEDLGGRWGEAKAILRSMPGAVIALDLERRIMNANRVAERVLEIDADAARGRLLHETVRQPALLAFVEESVGSTDLVKSEFTLRGVTERVVAASSRPLLDADKEIAGVVVVLQDVTRLRKLENLRRDFAANASHELRTPVTNILGYTETLAECGDMEPVERERFIAVIRRNAERLAAILEDMLELARLESPESVGFVLSEPTVVQEMFDDLAASVAPDLEKKNIRLEIECDGDLLVGLNRGLMGQAVGNFLANAVRYSPEGTGVRVRGRLVTAGDGATLAELSVRDEGPGIPEEHLSRLFERFYRVDPARSREMGGTGLGLAIAKHVALLHGGEVGVESEVGSGSTFWIRVPYVGEQA